MTHPLISLLREWLVRIRSRREIGTLDRHSIEDFGSTPGQMHFEAQKPFWRA
jgi:uncharacterized protein YjiS (DUF1127 family)